MANQASEPTPTEDDFPTYQELAEAHLDALAHASFRDVEDKAPDSSGNGSDGPTTAEPYYEAAQQVEAVARHIGVLLPLQELALRYGLEPMEVDALVWAFVQQSRTGDLPTLGEFLTVRLDTSSARNKALTLFRREARLRHWGLLDLIVGPNALPDNLHQRIFSLPEPVNAFLLGERTLGDRLGGVATLVREIPDDILMRGVGASRIGIPHDVELRELIERYINRLTARTDALAFGSRSLVLELCAPPRSGGTCAARELAREFGADLIELDASRLAVCSPEAQIHLIDEITAVLRLYDAWLAIDRVEVLSDNAPALEALAALTDRVATVVVAVSRLRLPPKHPLGTRALRHFEIETPEPTRHVLWQNALFEEQVTPPSDTDVRMVAAKFDLNAGQISNAARLVALRTFGAKASPDFEMLDSSAFEQQRGNLSQVATVRQGRGTMDDLVLPETEKTSIREIIRAAKYRTQLLHGWRFKERFSYGTGIVALFSGEPGTGKTFAAEVIAAALGLELFQIAVPQVVSKWVGETEKQISRIFQEAKGSRALLLFDEADSLLGARTEVKTASDRYGNMATNHLLQAIEAYEGAVILTTNLQENLDSAAERRILFRVRFPFPGEDERAQLWQRMLPPGAPLADDIDFEDLGEMYELSGGYIKNAIIRAGYDALERGVSLDMAALTAAAEREARSSGRLVRRHTEGYERRDDFP